LQKLTRNVEEPVQRGETWQAQQLSCSAWEINQSEAGLSGERKTSKKSERQKMAQDIYNHKKDSFYIGLLETAKLIVSKCKENKTNPEIGELASEILRLFNVE
jgi:hypothetical protein